ncbi:MAG: ABC transporter substrate-binding protein [Hylemonella sp.]
MRRMWIGLLLALWLPAQATWQIIDERGVQVTLAAPPQRIVSLLPSLTETVCALGACQRLVGVDRYSNFPAAVRVLPQVGGGLDPNIEAIVALQPDLVLLSVSSRAAERLEALGLKVAALDTKSHADVRRVLGQVDTLLGTHAAPRVWQAIEAGIAEAARSLPPAARGLRVYFEVSRGPYAAGEASFIGETLARLGARNVVPASLGPFPKLNPEYVVRADPDVIMIGNRSMQAMAPYPGWQRIKAVREQRICVFPNEEAETIVRPGPRMAEAAWLMARCLREQGR